MSLTYTAIIPARGGSKGIPGKNSKSFCGKPLINWSIDIARESGLFSRIMVSTDDESIRAISLSAGAEVPFLRPTELAGDNVPTAPVVAHALKWLDAASSAKTDIVFILEPTSPTRQPKHIVEAAELLVANNGDSLASVSEVPHHYVPEKQLELNNSSHALTGLNGTPIAQMVHRRQDLRKRYAFNGLIWACAADLLRRQTPTLWSARVLGYPTEQSFDVDLDEPADWEPAEARMRTLLGSR